MNFVSLAFVLFLPAVFALHWGMRSGAARNAVLLAASYAFYGYWDWRFCGLLWLTSSVDFLVGRALSREARPGVRRGLVAASCTFNLGILCTFKYYDFFVGSFVRAASAAGWTVDLPLLRVLLPVGISFYTFQSLSYSIDVYRGRVRASGDYPGYLCYVAFFPQLVAGPIERSAALLPQILGERTFCAATARNGLRQMLYGFFVKMAIADNLQPFVHHVYAEPAPYNGAKLLFATCCFALQIYWDFAGYSHIAAGTASLFGVKLMQNFRYPYFACDIRDFWRRWHISLSTWFRDYVYIPLGGSRRTFPRTLANLMATFVLSGLWHGASWNFVLWGAWHGAGMVALVLWERWRDAGGGGCHPGTLRRAAGWAGTLAFVLGGWVLFRSADLRQAGEIFSGICLRPFAAEEAGRSLSNRFGMVPLVLAAAGLAVEWARRNALFPLDRLDRSGWPTAGRWLLYSAMIWLCLFYRHPGANTFIYFQF